jgi:WS/DGAT C-terminal domain
MTSIGRFALVSETKYNPSIITFVLQLENKGQNQKQLTANDFVQLWSLKQMPQRHPRFHQILHDSSNHLNSKKRTLMKSSSSSLSFHPTIVTDISQHVTESILPCNRFELQRIIGKMQLAQWDLSDSLWKVTICNNNSTTGSSILSTPSYTAKIGNTVPTSYLTHSTEGIDQSSSEPDGSGGRRLAPTLLLFRGHHVLADGASMAAAFMDMFDEADLLRNEILAAVQRFRLRRKRSKRTMWQSLWRKWVQLVQLCYGTIKSFIHIIRLLYCQAFLDPNPWKVIEQQSKIDQESVDAARRIVAWSDVASVEQVKWVADTLSDGDIGKKAKKTGFKITVNDVFIACVTAAMSKQLQYHRQHMQELSHQRTAAKQKAKKENAKVLDEQRYMHVAVPVHLKGGVVLPNESVSNCIGALVARVPCEMDNEDEFSSPSDSTTNRSVERLRAVSSELHAIKRTPTAIISYIMAKVLSNITTMNIFPSSWMSYLYSNANAGSMVVVSNNRGPSVPVHIDGHKVESITGFVPLPPGIPVGVVVMSYAGHINCALSAEPWAVPDGDQFMLWILEEYLELVNAAKAKQTQ